VQAVLKAGQGLHFFNSNTNPFAHVRAVLSSEQVVTFYGHLRHLPEDK